jgi:UDP-N-acetylglucosamine:LPS N-acetylglucosamine transferase
MKKVLIFTTSEGHLSLAQAAEFALNQAGFKTNLVSSFSQGYFSAYLPFYRYWPGLFKIPYKLGEMDQVQKATHLFFGRKMESTVKNAVKRYKPDLIVSTYLFYNPAIVKVLDYQKDHLPFINIVANPWTIHPFEFIPQAQRNVVYDQKGIRAGQQNGIPGDRLCSLGWLVKPDFYKTYDSHKIRKRLGLKNDVFTILICGGSEGTNMVLKIIPGLLALKKPVQAIVVCGANRNLYRTMLSFKNLVPKLKQAKIENLDNLSDNLKIIVYQYSQQMPELMAASDLVVGKAGPNLIFEANALHKPFFAICHISGQEDDNLELIKKKNIGLAEENIVRAIKTLRLVVQNPAYLNRYRQSIVQESEANKKAAQNLVNLISSLISPAPPA